MGRTDPARIHIRSMSVRDLPTVKRAIDRTGLFPSELLDAMTRPGLVDSDAREAWHVAELDGSVVGVTYDTPERMTAGTYNLSLIAVDPDRQGAGVGRALMRAAEARLAEAGGRLLLVETSGLPDFARTRAFYAGLGYRAEAVIRDFHDAGEDRVTFTTGLGRPAEA